MENKIYLKKYIINTDNNEDFYMYYHGPDSYFSLYDLDQWLREQVKYHDREELHEVRKELQDIMTKHGIDFYHVD